MARSKVYSFEQGEVKLDAALERRFRKKNAAWGWFRRQAPSDQKAALWHVASAKKEETRERRFLALLGHSARGERLPQFARSGRKEG